MSLISSVPLALLWIISTLVLLLCPVCPLLFKIFKGTKSIQIFRKGEFKNYLYEVTEHKFVNFGSGKVETHEEEEEEKTCELLFSIDFSINSYLFF